MNKEKPIEQGAATYDNSFSLFIQKHGRLLLILFAFLIALLLVAYRLTSSNASRAEKDYIAADIEFKRFQEMTVRDETAAQAALNQLNLLIQQHPELEAKYDARIAQNLLFLGNVEAAKPYIERTSARIKGDHLPTYSSYAQTTIAIDKGDYPQAIKEALALQQTLMSEQTQNPGWRSSGDVLLLFNLLRIASLQEQVGTAEAKKTAWKELDLYSKETNPKIYTSILNGVTSGQLSLLQYLEVRKR